MSGKLRKPHNHVPPVEQAGKMKVMAQLREKASQNMIVKPRLIISEEMADCDEGTMSMLPSQSSLSQVINRVRAKSRACPLPARFEDVVFPQELLDLDGENFLLYDSREDDNALVKCLVFGSRQGLQFLKGTLLLQYCILLFF